MFLNWKKTNKQKRKQSKTKLQNNLQHIKTFKRLKWYKNDFEELY